MTNQTIKLDYPAAIGIATSMKNTAEAFGENHVTLTKAVSSLQSNWSGTITKTMHDELNDMNADVKKIQQALLQMAELAISSANTLKQLDDGIAAEINKTQ
jgi:WXG100 family type VII secretion target